MQTESLYSTRVKEKSAFYQIYPYTSKVALNEKIDVLRCKFAENYQKELKPSAKILFIHYTFIQKLGEGGFGPILLVREKRTTRCYALKVVSKEYIMKRSHIRYIYNEKKVLHAMDHPFFINLVNSFKDTTNIYFLIPFFTGGDLYRMLCRFKHFPDKLCEFYGAQVILAIEFLHRCNIIHRDLKPENIMLESNGYIKIIEFGFSKCITGRTYSFCGTPEYISPEIILHKGHGFASDWWSFGVLLYEMKMGFSPFFSKSNHKIVNNILTGYFDTQGMMSKPMADLIHNLLQPDLTKRYGNLKGGVGDIKDHLLFRRTNFSQIFNRMVVPPYKPIIKDDCDVEYYKTSEPLTIPTIGEVDKYTKEFADF